MVTDLGQVPKLEHKKKKATFSTYAGPAEGVKKPVKAKKNWEEKDQDILCNRSK